MDTFKNVEYNRKVINMNFEQELEALRKRHVLHIENEEMDLTSEKTMDNEKHEIYPIEANVLLYQTDDGDVSVSVHFYEETFWMNVKAMSELFDCSINNISMHLKNIFSEKELDEISTIKFFEIVQTEGNRRVSRSVKHYSLDAIISVGYRVNSKKATKFRQWATNTLKEYMIKGFVINDDMLKNGKAFGQDYFDELLERIKEIRASERRFYQKITDIYAQCSYDYDPSSPITKTFFKTVQNKLLFAVTGHTAPELINTRADSSKEHMGLTTWKNAPDGKILQSDVTISKNYLDQKELSGLNDIVNMYLDYAENQAKRNKLMAMKDWINKLNSFLNFNEYDILNNSGIISREVADKLAIKEYKTYRIKQDQEYTSDFDKATEKYMK